ncbi:hypothetical protein [Sphingomonas pituitosa]|uniref:hypothetical protein n=1 Tax=Sphingomonas pituitosa TaxID=99597 RepID=UPI000AD60ADF|nr:hypothetical protein [Sphingomonas pituitosa]
MLPPLSAAPLFLLLAVPTAGERPLHAQYTVTNIGGGLGTYVDEKVIFGQVSTGRWIAERVRHDRSWCGKRDAGGKCVAVDSTVHDWLDGATCTSVAPAISELRAIRPTGFAPIRLRGRVRFLHGHDQGRHHTGGVLHGDQRQPGRG